MAFKPYCPTCKTWHRADEAHSIQQPDDEDDLIACEGGCGERIEYSPYPEERTCAACRAEETAERDHQRSFSHSSRYL